MASQDMLYRLFVNSDTPTTTLSSDASSSSRCWESPLAPSLEGERVYWKGNSRPAAQADKVGLYRGRGTCPRIEEILRFGENVTLLVMSDVLRRTTVTDRTKALKFYIQVCMDLLLKVHDFHSFVAVYIGLTSPPVYRLNSVWRALRTDDHTYISYLSCMGKVFSPHNGFAAYTNRCHNCVIKRRPFIPWFKHVLLHSRLSAIGDVSAIYGQESARKSSKQALKPIASRHKMRSVNIQNNSERIKKLNSERSKKLTPIRTSGNKYKNVRKLFSFKGKKRHGVSFKSDVNIMRTQSLIRKQTDRGKKEIVSKVKGRRPSLFPQFEGKLKTLDSYCHETANSIIRSAIYELVNERAMHTADSCDNVGQSYASEASSEDDTFNTDDHNILNNHMGDIHHDRVASLTPTATQLTGEVPIIVEPSPEYISTDVELTDDVTLMETPAQAQQLDRHTDSFGNPISASFYLKQFIAAQHRIHIPLHAIEKAAEKDNATKEYATHKTQAQRKLSTSTHTRHAHRRKSLFEKSIEEKAKRKPENTEFDKSMKQTLNRMKSTILEYDAKLDQPLKEMPNQSELGKHQHSKYNDSNQLPHAAIEVKHRGKRSSISPGAHTSFYDIAVDASHSNRMQSILHTSVKQSIHKIRYSLFGDHLDMASVNKSNNGLKHWLRIQCTRVKHEEISNKPKKQRNMTDALRSTSIERIDFDTVQTNSSSICSLCAFGECLYTPTIWERLIEFQLQFVNQRIRSKERVKTLLNNAILATECLSEYDMFRISRNIE